MKLGCETHRNWQTDGDTTLKRGENVQSIKKSINHLFNDSFKTHEYKVGKHIDRIYNTELTM